MNPSPADQSERSLTPNGGAPPPARRAKPQVNPLVRPKQRRKRAPGQSSGATQTGVRPNGIPPPHQGRTQDLSQRSGRPTPPPSQPSQQALQAPPELTQSLFSAPPSKFTDIPLILTKRQLREKGARAHVLRFHSRRDVDPRDENTFMRPVRLQRRDARAPPPGSKEEAELAPEDEDEVKEREKRQTQRTEREAQRAIELAQIAPGKSNATKKAGGKNKKTTEVHQQDLTEEGMARRKLRYEEALPWHLEDFENKQTWVGSYESALSGTYAAMSLKDGKFYVAPVEKWYRFAPKPNFKTLSIDEAEKRMSQKVKDPRWFMETQLKNEEQQRDAAMRKVNRGLFLGKIEGQGRGSISARGFKRETDDLDEIDYQADASDDDGEGQIEGDEQDTKEIEERIKRDQRQANVFDMKDEQEFEVKDRIEMKEKEADRKLGKKVKKALMNREKNYLYDTDSDANPYSESSEPEDTEAERQKEEEAKKDADAKKATGSEIKRPASGASSRGTNTPNHRSSKHPDARGASNALRRPGSPNASDLSGNESSRKKKKKQSLTVAESGLASRPRSPANGLAGNAPSGNGTTTKRPRPAAGSGSDGEGAGSGGEMSDGARKRQKIKQGSPPVSSRASPNASRAGSPQPIGVNGSRAGSPEGEARVPTVEEFRAVIPAEGLTVKELMKKLNLGGEFKDKKFQDVFHARLREVSSWEKATKRLMPKQ